MTIGRDLIMRRKESIKLNIEKKLSNFSATKKNENAK